ncbi:hypothetical protein HYH03_017084 [Edaphochlamys debaryana]|uniref:EGF-like domain-containing protein n=1 Tax=Edaphochlamys debaryana TaxID=47281 RepID=A0A835XII6_9CHLO|nr:hypothetical protein HYH03_017084 [Edaphochlamys debaryana]|eukprot:KAG2484064.1 hypothetical protein HYH03_017084 [Edaphochlamys debaryana]
MLATSLILPDRGRVTGCHARHNCVALPLSALLLAVLLSASGRRLLEPGGGSGGVVQGRKPCARGCLDRGNCNYETGRCECPWGWRGEACEVDFLAACRQTPDDPGHATACTASTARIRTAATYFEGGRWTPGSPCWLYGNNATGTAGALGRPQNSSRYPENPEAETIWYEQIPIFYNKDTYDESMRLHDPKRLYRSPIHRPGIPHMQDDHIARPLSHCSDSHNCSNGRGYCMEWEPGAPSQCFCHLGWRGPSCSDVSTGLHRDKGSGGKGEEEGGGLGGGKC